jgi:hypothetical protein
MMERTTPNDQTIIQYLLNALSAEDKLRFEEAYLEDEILYEWLQVLEEELIEDYARGDLSGRNRQLFERHYLASEQRRARIEDARQLLHVCSVNSPAETAAGDRIDDKFFSIHSWFRLFAKQHLTLGLGVATALLLILGVGLVIELLRLQGRLAAISEERAAIEQRAEDANRQLAQQREHLIEERKQTSTLREKLGDALNRLDRLEQEPDRSQSSKNRIVFLALEPGVRDINKPETAAISADTEFVELRVTLLKQGAAIPGAYRAVVKTVDGGEEIWGLEGIKPRQTGSAQYVVVRVPADRFRAVDGQDFTVRLSARSVGVGDYEELESCYFQVISR